jgi:hypothetical protein
MHFILNPLIHVLRILFYFAFCSFTLQLFLTMVCAAPYTDKMTNTDRKGRRPSKANPDKCV